MYVCVSVYILYIYCGYVVVILFHFVYLFILVWREKVRTRQTSEPVIFFVMLLISRKIWREVVKVGFFPFAQQLYALCCKILPFFVYKACLP